jgi:hypothetical protein
MGLGPSSEADNSSARKDILCNVLIIKIITHSPSLMADQNTRELPPQQEHSRQPQPTNQIKPKTTTCGPYKQNNQRQLQ